MLAPALKDTQSVQTNDIISVYVATQGPLLQVLQCTRAECDQH